MISNFLIVVLLLILVAWMSWVTVTLDHLYRQSLRVVTRDVFEDYRNEMLGVLRENDKKHHTILHLIRVRLRILEQVSKVVFAEKQEANR